MRAKRDPRAAAGGADGVDSGEVPAAGVALAAAGPSRGCWRGSAIAAVAAGRGDVERVGAPRVVCGQVRASQRVDGLGVGHTDEAGGRERDRRERGGRGGLWGGVGGWRPTLMPASTGDDRGGTRVPICSPSPRHIHRQRRPPPPVPAAPSPPPVSPGRPPARPAARRVAPEPSGGCTGRLPDASPVAVQELPLGEGPLPPGARG